MCAWNRWRGRVEVQPCFVKGERKDIVIFSPPVLILELLYALDHS
jgi:hypothetical protein